MLFYYESPYRLRWGVFLNLRDENRVPGISIAKMLVTDDIKDITLLEVVGVCAWLTLWNGDSKAVE